MKKTLVLVLLLLPSVCYPQSTYSVVKNIERNWLTWATPADLSGGTGGAKFVTYYYVLPVR